MIPISETDFDRAVEEALADVPEDFRPYLENVVIEVQNRPSAALQREEGITDDVLGLYVGVPLEDKGPGNTTVPLPDRVYIFRENLRRMCSNRAELVEEIRVTVLHELGHHFGLDEDRLTELGYD